MGAGLLRLLRFGQHLATVLLAVVICFSGAGAAALVPDRVVEYDSAQYEYDVVPDIASIAADASVSSEWRVVGRRAVAMEALEPPVGYAYDLSRSFVAPSGLLDDFADVGSGASLIRRVDVDGVPVSIRSGHGYRPDHGSVDITGVLGRDAVDSAVATDLATRVSAGNSVTRAGSGHSTFQTVVGGHTVEYRAVFVPATGRYEVGTYYIP